VTAPAGPSGAGRSRPRGTRAIDQPDPPHGPRRLLWRTRPIGAEPTVSDWALLGEADGCRAARFTHPAGLTRFVVGRALLRETIGLLRTDLAATPFEIEVEASGRLRVAGHPKLAISLSHTDGLAVAVVAEGGSVGIDVEAMDREDLPRASMWLTGEEEGALAHLEPQLRRLALLHLWVAKEAALKGATGPGVATRRRIAIGCSHAGEGHDLGIGPVAGPPAGQVPDAPGAEVPTTASWCGTGHATIDQRVGSHTQQPHHTQVADSEPCRLAIDWFALADRFLIAVASEPVADISR
jgi:phosphopantetheinyl transferase (holo-ACP synthase)